MFSSTCSWATYFMYPLWYYSYIKSNSNTKYLFTLVDPLVSHSFSIQAPTYQLHILCVSLFASNKIKRTKILKTTKVLPLKFCFSFKAFFCSLGNNLQANTLFRKCGLPSLTKGIILTLCCMMGLFGFL